MRNLPSWNFIAFAFCALFATCFFTACGTSGAKKQQADLHLQIGTGYLRSGNVPYAMNELSLAVELDPENPVVHNNLALAYFMKNRIPDAETSLKRALELNPNYSDAKNNLGRIYIELGRYDEAVSTINQVVEDLRYPDPEKAYLNLGMAYYGKNDFQQAKNAFLNSLKVRPKFCPAQAQYGISLYQLKQYKLATEAFDQLIADCEKKFDEAHFYSALSFFQLGKKEEARARLEEVIKIYPDSKFVAKSRELLKAIN